MLNNKENEKIIDDYDYLSNAASTMDCTGLIHSIPMSDAELEAYNDLYQYQPPCYQGQVIHTCQCFRTTASR